MRRLVLAIILLLLPPPAMAQSYTACEALIKPVPLSNATNNVWGAQLNTNFDLIDTALAGNLQISLSSGANVVLQSFQGSPDQSRARLYTLTGALPSNVTVFFPANRCRQFTVANNTTGAYSVTVAVGTVSALGSSVTVPRGNYLTLYSDGTNILNLSGPTSGTLSVGSMSALRGLPVPADQTNQYLAGFYSPGDGGEGSFTYSASSTATDDNGTVIAPNIGSGRWLRNTYATQPNVRWWGAVCNGTTIGGTNDTAVIQTAMTWAGTNNAATVNYPRDSGCVQKDVTVPSGVNVNLQGSTLYLPASGVGGSDNIFAIGGTGNVIDCLGGRFYNTGSDQPNALILLISAVNTTIQNCDFANVYYLAINGNQSVNTLITRNYFTATTAEYPAVWFAKLTGLGQSSPKNAQVVSNVFTGTGVMMASDGGVIENNQFYSPNLGGAIIGFDDRSTTDSYISNNITISNNLIDTVPLNGTNDGTGMELHGTNYIITGNKIKKTAKTAISLQSVNGAIIAHNTMVDFGTGQIDEFDQSAIALGAVAGALLNVDVHDNECIDDQGSPTGTHCVALGNSGFAYSISHARIHNNTAMGITEASVALVLPNSNPIISADVTFADNDSNNSNNYLFAAVIACTSITEGSRWRLTDSTTNTWGATIAGSGSNHVLGYCDGTNVTVMGK